MQEGAKTLLSAGVIGLMVLQAPLFGDDKPPLTSDEILKKVSYPPEFEATVFASPPNISYPIFLSASPDGALFVGCDENGSLDRKPNRGRVVMCQDLDGDGRADKFTDFAKMDSPRGVAWDGSTRTLYVMHPPNLTAYHDDANSGMASRQEDLITGLGFGLDFRGADHTINGIRLGIDGWIYIACGDYGAVKATGRDGRSLSLRGGGIVRVRPDGTGLEQVIWGTRNILAVAISPTMELFTRDNTNDGDDWNDRLSFNPFGAQMGYPTLFRNFSNEIIPAMVDFGGGSPVGSIFIDEPSLPMHWAHGFYSVEWGRSEIDLHPLTRHGGTWKADTGQFMKMTRATDLEVDGAGHLFAASWDGATFTYAGPNVGYVIQLRPKGANSVAVPDFKTLSEKQLVDKIGSGSAVWRQAAQRELLVRGPNAGVAKGLEQLLGTSTNIGVQVAGIFSLKQLLGVKSHPVLMKFLKNDSLREYVLKALADDQRLAREVPARPFVEALTDPNPRIRLQAVTGLGHLGKLEAASGLLARTADSDYTVAHLAVQALRWLKASEVCLRALDSADETLRPGALRALQGIYDPAVVDGLLQRLSTSNPELRHGIYNTLCRLDKKEAPYTDPSMWWGTRPDTGGPIYKPEKWASSDTIEDALRQGLITAQDDEAKLFVTTLLRTKVSFPGFTELMLNKAGHDTASRLDVIAPLLSPKTPVAPDLVNALQIIAGSSGEPPELRARAFRMLGGILEKHFSAVRDAFVQLAGTDQQGPLATVWEEFTRDTRLSSHVNDFASLAQTEDSAKRILGSTVLVNILASPVSKDQKSKNSAHRAISHLWEHPSPAVTLLEVIGQLEAAQLAPEVREQLKNPNQDVARAAEFALARLRLDKPTSQHSKTIGEITYEEAVTAALAAKGDAKAGEQLFLKQGCALCHTVSEKDPPKGPMLGGITTRYSRLELCESILKPSAKIAQGFESQRFNLKNGDQVDGFVVKESGDSIEVRNVAGTTAVLEKSDIVARERLAQSIMPEGLTANITPAELASLLAFLESTRPK